MTITRLEALDVADRRVLVRTDFNVPLLAGAGDTGSAVSDDFRIRGALPTLTYLSERGARVIAMSHLGRPKGAVVEKLRMAPVAARLGELLGKPVAVLPGLVGDAVQDAARALGPGELALTENLRFDPREKAGDPEFGRALAALGQAYVCDAFGTMHRGDASMTIPPRHLPSAAGLLVQRELDVLGTLMERPARVYVAVLGGAKVSDKLPILAELLKRVDTLAIGGAMAYTFLKAQGRPIGRSPIDAARLDDARRILADAQSRGVTVLLPVDHVVAPSREARGEARVASEISAEACAFDIGPQTRAQFAAAIAGAATVLLCGPPGVFEVEAFAAGTHSVLQALAASGGTTVVGGGDSVAAARQFGVVDALTHVSTGGGASLEFLSGKTMPGLEALRAGAVGA